jgi:hypothetical protein
VLDGMRRVLIGFLPWAASAYANLVRNRGVGTRTVGAPSPPISAGVQARACSRCERLDGQKVLAKSTWGG